jgi:hypothetical protein
MMNEGDAESAIEGLNRVEFFGRELVVRWAEKQRPLRSVSEMSTTLGIMNAPTENPHK